MTETFFTFVMTNPIAWIYVFFGLLTAIYMMTWYFDQPLSENAMADAICKIAAVVLITMFWPAAIVFISVRYFIR